MARQKIVKLAQKISGMPKRYTENDPEYYGIECVCTDEMADLLLKMKMRVPMTLEEMAKCSGYTLERTTELAKEMAWIGLLEYVDIDGVDHYTLQIYAPGIMEFMMMNIPLVEKYPQIAKAFVEITGNVGGIVSMVPVGGAGNGMRVIPIESALPSGSKIASYEQISAWLDKSDIFAVGPCACRTARRIMGEGCGHLEEDICIAIGSVAEYMIKTGRCHEITYEEALEIIKRAEDDGLMHQVSNVDGDGKVLGICNCCRCSCLGLQTSLKFNTPNLSRSNFVAKVDDSKCVACGQCVEYCPANAVKLGQKLPTHNGPVKYAQAELPDEQRWGSDKWNLDYRDSKVNTEPTGTSPCKANCPAHIAVQGYLKLAAMGRYRDALALIKKENPFPAICGRVCNRRCEAACTRGGIDEPLAIDDVKKFIAEQDMKSEHRFVPPVVNETGKQYDEKIAIIGSGPAGLSCAYYLACRGYRPTVFEKDKQIGGMMIKAIPSFRLEKDVVESELEVLREIGVEFKTGVEVGKDVTIEQLREQGYKAFYLAIGLQGARKLGIPGEDAEGVCSGLSVTKRVNAGENVQMPGKVVVIGGGNVASDIARTAVRCGADRVDLYCLENEQDMPMGESDRSECREEGIALHPGWGPVEIGSSDGKVKNIRFRKCLSTKADDGSFAPTFDDAECVTVDADWILLCVGQSVIWGDLLNGTKCEAGSIVKADPLTWQTAEPDIFAGGDVATGPKFCIDAIATGKQGAESLHRFVHPGQSLTIGRDRRIFHELNKDDVVISDYDHTPRQKPVQKAGTPTATLHDLRGTLTEEQVRKETERCLGCGRTVVDQNICLGCGMCTTKCMFDAITLERKFDAPMIPHEKMMSVIGPYTVKRGIKIVRNDLLKAVGRKRES